DPHFDKPSAAEIEHRARIVSQRVQTRDDPSHAGTANHVDGDRALFQRPDDTDVGEAAGAASAQNEADRAPRQAAREVAHVSVRSEADVMMGRDATLCEPRPSTGGAASPWSV